MDHDDETIGRFLTRREALTLLGATGLSLLIGCNSPEDATVISGSTNLPGCIVQPQSTEGPYYVDVDTLRQDITEGKAGMPLDLTFDVLQVGEDGCKPLENALVEIWHCDKDGVYSGVLDPGFDTMGETWLRGGQMTNAAGQATFSTIFPGWYGGRCVHIHFRVSPTETSQFSSQIYFEDAFNDQILTQSPYNKGTPDTSNARDPIFIDTLVVEAVESAEKVTANFSLGIDLSAL